MQLEDGDAANVPRDSGKVPAGKATRCFHNIQPITQ